ncbi:MAG: hypothetical protein ACLR1P_10085 [Oscillospiraceae bacterium]
MSTMDWREIYAARRLCTPERATAALIAPGDRIFATAAPVASRPC